MVLKVDGTFKVIGIVSASLATRVRDHKGILQSICDLDNYMVYTDVSKFHSWINQVIIET
jgi:hypothetical protein